MSEVIVPGYMKNYGEEAWKAANNLNPLDPEQVAIVDEMLIPADVYKDIAQAAAKCGTDVAHFIIEAADKAAIETFLD